METWHNHIEGQVQGVGFRPFVFLMAKKYGLTGWVNNATDGVHIEMNTDEKTAIDFFDNLIKNAPVLSKITSHSILKTAHKFFDNFQIIHSEMKGESNLLLTPDFALCADCKAELHAETNRRNGYPFITCTHCGPRFSIIHQLPYDRVNTKMDNLKMCSSCNAEYENPLNRRYYSQTNSCPNCSIELSLYDAKQNKIAGNSEGIIDAIVQLWEQGKIVAIKGIGGY